MVASSAGAILPVMLAVPWPPRLMVGTTRPRLGLSQHITDDIGLAGQHLRDLADACGGFLVHDVVRVLEDAQQVIPVQIALHPRRIVVDAERQIGGVGNIEEEAARCRPRARRYRRAPPGWRRRRRCPWRTGHWRWSSRYCCRCSRRRSACGGLHLRGLDDDLLLLLRRQHRAFAGRAHDQDCGGAVVLLEFEQRAETRRSRPSRPC